MHPNLRGLRSRLFFYGLALILPMAVLGALVVREHAERGKSQLRSSALTTASVLAARVQDFADSATSSLELIARLPGVRDQRPDESRAIFAESIRVSPSFLNVFLANEDGAVLSTAVWRSAAARTVVERSAFWRAILGAQPAFSSRDTSRSTGLATVTVFVPLFDRQGQSAGALGADLSLRQLGSSLAGLFAEGATVILLDEDGTVLLHPDWELVATRTNMAALPPVRAAFRGERGAAEFASLFDGQDWLVAYEPIPSLRWIVLVAYPADSVSAATEDTLWQGLWLVAGTALLALILGTLMSRQITKPLAQLATATRAVAGGALGAQVTITTRDELQVLADDFNAMSRQLAEDKRQIAAAQAELQATTDQLQLLIRRTLEVQEEERRRIAAEVHDGVAQLAVTALCVTQTLRRPDSVPGVVMHHVELLQRLLTELVGDLRAAVYDLRPTLLDELGLEAALDDLVAKTERGAGLRCTFKTRGEPFVLADRSELALYRVAQEAIQNAVSHASARRLAVSLGFTAGRVRLRILDDGRGIDWADQQARRDEHLGLASMRERAQSIGGSLRILSTPSRGTLVVVDVPAPAADVDVGAAARADPRRADPRFVAGASVPPGLQRRLP